MNYTRTRRSIAAAVLVLMAGVASAQAYPNRPIKIIVPFPPGGGNDTIARVVGQKLSERLGQPVVIDNRAGANGIIGLQALANSAPDGYTLGVGAAGPMAVNPSMYEHLQYDPVKDFEPITNLANFPLVLVTNAAFAPKTIPRLITYAKANPGKVFFASPGIGNSGHLAGELFNSMAKVKTTAVQYKGNGPATADLLSGQVQMLYSSVPGVIEFVKQGRLTALAVGSNSRIAALPDVPTIAESGVPGYEAYSWVGLVAPRGTPAPIVAMLNREIVRILKDKDVEEKLIQQGAIPVGDTPAEFSAYIKAEIKKWGAVVKAASIKGE